MDTPPVANARTAQTAGHATTADNATNAGNAANANIVGGYAPSGLVRAARGASTDVIPLSNTYQTLTAVSMTAPAAGFVVLTGAFSLFGGAGCPCSAESRLRHTNTGATSLASYETASTGTYEAISLTYVFSVAGSGTQTFALEALEYFLPTNTGTPNGFDSAISAVDVPFGSGPAGTP